MSRSTPIDKQGFGEMLTTGLSLWQQHFLDGLSTADNSNVLTLRSRSPSIINPTLLSKLEWWRETKLGRCSCRFFSEVGGTFSRKLVACEGANPMALMGLANVSWHWRVAGPGQWGVQISDSKKQRENNEDQHPLKRAQRKDCCFGYHDGWSRSTGFGANQVLESRSR